MGSLRACEEPVLGLLFCRPVAVSGPGGRLTGRQTVSFFVEPNGDAIVLDIVHRLCELQESVFSCREEWR